VGVDRPRSGELAGFLQGGGVRFTIPWRRSATLALGASLIAASLLASACSQGQTAGPMDPAWPSEVRGAPVVVRQAYAFAHDHTDLLREIPCYCGCGAIGHTSNYDCYIADEAADGTITYDPHALGCSICVDITQDVARLLEEGRSPQEIRASIDSTYARYGPSNMP